MKKQLLTAAAIALVGAGSAYAQRTITGKAGSPNGGVTQMIVKERCSTPAPSAEWDTWFNQKVEEYKTQRAAEKQSNPNAPAITNYNIPVVVHIIHGGQAVGTYPNLAAGQINSQITVLNQDYSGTGFKTNTYPSTAFQTYVTNGSIPAASQDGTGRIKIANTGIQFCMALIDKNGATMTEPGIDRVDWHNISGATDPALQTTASGLQTLIDTKIKPGTIWDPTKYINMWVTDEKQTSPSPGLLGYATFPPNSTLTGIPSAGTSTTDGFWAYTHAFGSATVFPGGTYDATYKYGRTCTHEIGHWLGLRHVWGDNGQCGATDYCVDTPPEKGTTGPPAGCYYGTPTYPSQANTCTRPDGVAGANITNVNGDMFMNFMDYTDDIAMYMFTNDQTTRIQTAMANSNQRKLLGTHGLCSTTPQPPTANFTFPTNICQGVAAAFTDASGNVPTSWSWSVSPSTGVTITTATTQNPNITFSTAGTYTVSLTATNAQGNNTLPQTVTVGTCAFNACDTLNTMLSTDTLVCYTSGGGYVAGNNQYGDAQEANFYSDAGIGGAQITGVIAIFYRNGANGTKGTTGNVVCQILGGDNSTGPNATVVATASATLSTIVATPSVTNIPYCANPALTYSTAFMKPYKYSFASPVTVPVGGFFANIVLPTTTGDTVALMSNTAGQIPVNTAWLNNTGAWYPYTDASMGWTAINSLAILPIVCPATGIADVNSIASNISMFPNPSNGNITFVTTLPKASDLSFTVTNTLGQVVYQKTEKNVSNNMISLDLTSKDKGIYLVTITGSNGEKTVKKVVIE